MSSSTPDTTLPTGWQWVTRARDLNHGSIVSKLWWRNGVPDFRVTVKAGPIPDMAVADVALVVTRGPFPKGWDTKGVKYQVTWPTDPEWVHVARLLHLPTDPLSAAAYIELTIHDQVNDYVIPPWKRRWPDVGGKT